MWKTLKRRLYMEETNIAIDCDLLTWIKDRAEKARESQIIILIENGKVVRASCFTRDAFGKDKI